jgi:Xaa-Pro aminopeptidase
MQEAGIITDQIFAKVLKLIRPGVTAYELTREIDYQAIQLGATGMSFHTKVVIGGETVKQSYHPDGKTSNTQVVPGATIAFDFGIIYKGYVSDFGRTVFCDTPPKQLADYYRLVIASQDLGISLMKDGQITAAGLNSAMREVFIEQGLGNSMGMRFGHGIGIDVHEPPFLFERDETLLGNGMCLTIEPSLRLPHSVWIRVEDVVQVTPAGGVPFSTFSRELMTI